MHFIFRYHSLPLSLFLLIASQTSLCLAQETPEAVAEEYFAQLASGGFDNFARLMHPDELTKFRHMIEPVVETALADPDQGTLFAIFADSTDGQQVQDFFDAAFMNTFMEWATTFQPGMVEALQSTTVEALGHVREGDDLHVVVRMSVSVEDFSIDKLSVLSLREFTGQPKMLLTGEMKGFANAFSR